MSEEELYIKCEYCETIVYMPDIVTFLSPNKKRIVFVCGECAKQFDVDPQGVIQSEISFDTNTGVCENCNITLPLDKLHVEEHPEMDFICFCQECLEILRGKNPPANSPTFFRLSELEHIGIGTEFEHTGVC